MHQFDMGFIEANCKRQGIEKEFTVVDTVALARVLMPQLNRFKLDTVAKALKYHWRTIIEPLMMPDVRQRFL